MSKGRMMTANGGKAVFANRIRHVGPDGREFVCVRGQKSERVQERDHPRAFLLYVEPEFLFLLYVDQYKAIVPRMKA